MDSQLPTVRFCSIGISSKGGNSESTKSFTFLINETFAYNEWNSSISYEATESDCWDKIARNESDIFPFDAEFPQHSNILHYFTLAEQDKRSIISSFVPVNRSMASIENTSCLSSLYSISVPVVAIACLFLIAFYCLFKYCCTYTWRCRTKTVVVNVTRNYVIKKKRKKIKHKYTPSSLPHKLLIGLLLRQFSACSGLNRKKSVFSLVLIISIAFVSNLHFMFVSFEKTQLVVLDRPFIFDSYTKVVYHPRTYPLWMSEESQYLAFEKAEKGSINQHLWLKFLSHCRTAAPKACLARLQPDNAISYLKRISDQEIVLIASEFGARLIHAGLCPLAEAFSLNPLIVTTDEHEDENLSALGYSRLMDQSMPQVAAYITKRGVRTLESGILLKLAKPTRSLVNGFGDASAVRKCLYPEKRTEESPEVLDKSLAQYDSLIIFCSSIIAIAFAFHLIQMIATVCKYH